MNRLTPFQARRQAFWLNVGGWTFGLACMALLVVAALKSIYTLAQTARTPFEAALAVPLGRAVAFLYSIPQSIAPAVTDWVWRAAPDLNLRAPLIAAENAGILAVYFLLLLSLIPRGRATRLRRALAEHEQRMQQIYWEETARQRMRAGVPLQEVENQLEIKISIENQKAPWHTTLIGIIVLGVVLPLVVDVIKIIVGLAKLP